MRSPPDTAISELDLLGWKREVFALYQRVRELEPEAAWREWRAGRDRLFATHPQTPLGADSLARFEALRFFAYDPAFRVTGSVVATEPAVREIDSSTGERIRFRQFGRVEFELSGDSSRCRCTGWRATEAGCSSRSPTPPAAATATAAAATCWTRSRAPTWAGRTGGWCSTSTSPTTPPAPTTRAGRARCRPGRAGWRSPSRRASTPSCRDRWRRRGAPGNVRRVSSWRAWPRGSVFVTSHRADWAGYRYQRHVHCWDRRGGHSPGICVEGATFAASARGKTLRRTARRGVVRSGRGIAAASVGGGHAAAGSHLPEDDRRPCARHHVSVRRRYAQGHHLHRRYRQRPGRRLPRRRHAPVAGGDARAQAARKLQQPQRRRLPQRPHLRCRHRLQPGAGAERQDRRLDRDLAAPVPVGDRYRRRPQRARRHGDPDRRRRRQHGRRVDDLGRARGPDRGAAGQGQRPAGRAARCGHRLARRHLRRRLRERPHGQVRPRRQVAAQLGHQGRRQRAVRPAVRRRR